MGIIENFKDILNIADAVKNADLYKKVAETQSTVMQLMEENHALKAQIKELQEQQDIGARLHPQDNAYYLDDGKQLDGPFCLRCWDVDKNLVRERHGATAGTHYCPECAIRRR